jgi:hypothetical protein
MRRLFAAAVAATTLSACNQTVVESQASRPFSPPDKASAMAAATLPTAAQEGASAPDESKPVGLGLTKLAAATFNALSGTSDLLAAAEKGVPLGISAGDLHSQFHDAPNASGAFCETINRIRKFLADAADDDAMQCIVRAALEGEVILLDGAEHVVDLNLGGGRTFKAKLQLEGDAEAVTSLRMHACMGGERQTHFFDLKVAGIDVTVTSRREAPAELPGCTEAASMVRSVMYGKLDVASKLAGLKTIGEQSATVCKATGATFRHAEATVVQSAANISYDGYSKEADRDLRLRLFAALLDSNDKTAPYSLQRLALGDGAGRITDLDEAQAQGWSGDTLAVNPDEPRLGKVEGDLPPIAPKPEAGFGSGELWDCSGTPELTKDASALAAACEERYLLDETTVEDCRDL